MIVKALLSPVFLLLRGIILLLPSGLTLPDWAVSFFTMIQKALFFFPGDVFTTVITFGVLDISAHIGWSVIEWLYKKLPRCRLNLIYKNWLGSTLAYILVL